MKYLCDGAQFLGHSTSLNQRHEGRKYLRRRVGGVDLGIEAANVTGHVVRNSTLVHIFAKLKWSTFMTEPRFFRYCRLFLISLKLTLNCFLYSFLFSYYIKLCPESVSFLNR